MNWPWRRKARVPRYVDAPELMHWAQRYAAMEDLPEPVRRCYSHVIDEIGRMEWHQ